MQQRHFGNTELQTSAIGFGTLAFGLPLFQQETFLKELRGVEQVT